MRRAALTATIVAATIILAGCTSGSGTAPATEGGDTVEVVFVAYDMGYDPDPVTVPAGPIDITLVNQGAAVHNVIIEEAGNINVVEARPGETQTGTITLKAGTYTIYCDIPGHRSAGMDRTLTAE